MSSENKQIIVPTDLFDSLLSMIEKRIREIGQKYQANGRSYQDDLELSALRAIARQMGFDFEILADTSGFAVTRHAVTNTD